MNKCTFNLLILLFLITPLKNTWSRKSTAPFLEKKVLLVVHSYAMDYEWTAEEDKGIVKAFSEYHLANKGWKIERIFLDTKKSSQSQQIKKAIHNAKKKIAQLSPQAVILTDDDAAKGLLTYLKTKNTLVSVAGINGKIEDYGYVNGEKGIVGSLERHNISPVIKIVKHLRPTIKKVLLISETSITGQYMLKDFKDQLLKDSSLKTLGIKKIDEFVDTDFERLKARLKRVDPKKTVVVFVAFFTYRDKKGQYVSYKQIDKWVNENTKFLDVGCAVFNVKGGRLISLAISAEEMGSYSAKELFQRLLQNNENKEYSIRRKNPLSLVINRDRAKNLAIEIPYSILTYAGVSNILFNN